MATDLIKSFIQKVLQGLSKGNKTNLTIFLDLYKLGPRTNPSRVIVIFKFLKKRQARER